MTKKPMIICTVSALAFLSACSGSAPAPKGSGVVIAAQAKVPEKTADQDKDSYPESQAYFTHAEEKWKLSEASQPLQKSVYPFYQKTMAAFLKDTKGENRVYSPLNVYIALGMLAECTDSDTRKQLLDVLGVNDITTLRRVIDSAWSANWNDDKVLTLKMANSAWMRNDFNYHQELMDRLAETYHASAYSGEMGTEEMNKALQDWLNENTNHLLEESVKNQKTKKDTVLALASTLYLKGSWASKFVKELTKDEIFHAPNKDMTVPMMHKDDHGQVYFGKGWKAVSIYVTDCGYMWIFLPDEGVDPETLADDPEIYELLKGNLDAVDSKNGIVQLALPKFDVSSEISLIEELKKLGVTSVFDFNSADFTPLTDDSDELAVSSIQHAARVKTDEEGVEAAAFTVIMVAEGAMLVQPEIIDFRCDRPFLFALTGQDSSVLFTGIVNQPAE